MRPASGPSGPSAWPRMHRACSRCTTRCSTATPEPVVPFTVLMTSSASPDPSNVRRLRLIVVGCGAVTRNSLLPVLAGHDRIEIVALVDRDVARARELADAYGISRIHDDASAVGASEADAAVVATPPAHHAPATLDFIARGWHVFVEKPMA